MDFIKFFIKDEVPAVGLSKFRDKRAKYQYENYAQENIGYRKQYFKPDYSNNFFLL